MRDLKSLSLLYAFIGGAILGAGFALLYAPESGKVLRLRVKQLLEKKGIDFSDDEVEQLVNQISAQIEQ